MMKRPDMPPRGCTLVEPCWWEWYQCVPGDWPMLGSAPGSTGSVNDVGYHPGQYCGQCPCIFASAFAAMTSSSCLVSTALFRTLAVVLIASRPLAAAACSL